MLMAIHKNEEIIWPMEDKLSPVARYEIKRRVLKVNHHIARRNFSKLNFTIPHI